MAKQHFDFQVDGPWARVDVAGGRLSILFGDFGQPGPWDVEFLTDEGERYLATVATLDGLQRIMEVWKQTGECLNGRYLWISDLIVVEKLDAASIAEVVEDLMRSGELSSAMTLADEGSS